MPFTLVHPAAVLPLSRGPLVASALVCGAMAPDLPYYVSLQWIGGDYNLTLTHDSTSLLWLDPAIGLVLFAVFHALVRRPTLALLPRAAAARMRWTHLRGARSLPALACWVVVSLVIGAATHLAWDALTDALGYAHSRELNLLSDAVGVLAIAVWARGWWRTKTPGPVPPGALLPPRTRAAILAVSVLVTLVWSLGRAWVVAAQASEDLRSYGGWSRSAVAEYAARELVAQAGVSLGVLLVAYAVVWQVARLLRNRAADVTAGG
ncbi:DUF4184 family protein [Nocardioides hwasunensis]|uniref:DUF4184 family protein n=1 Tax=Nocardioides hwasunensis TaxID=397258 RepID=A0ABR8MQ91_9ACTN|nr:DUF4184 family protein [Nocardioides hwasunensis]MBD3916264.1 DUF4184 family protein [Nocardioides hwasunensis]